MKNEVSRKRSKKKTFDAIAVLDTIRNIELGIIIILLIILHFTLRSFL